jgi:hypothetical protein
MSSFVNGFRRSRPGQPDTPEPITSALIPHFNCTISVINRRFIVLSFYRSTVPPLGSSRYQHQCALPPEGRRNAVVAGHPRCRTVRRPVPSSTQYQLTCQPSTAATWRRSMGMAELTQSAYECRVRSLQLPYASPSTNIWLQHLSCHDRLNSNFLGPISITEGWSFLSYNQSLPQL